MYELLNADCRDVLANMGDNTVDSIVTDPPYHLQSIVKRFGGANAAPQQFGSDGAFARAARGFMGETWDGGDIAFDPELWAEAMRVLKPGGYLLAFSGTRTYHRMAYAIELAGFEIRDMISWLYGSGFPKSHDISKAIDKAAGAERVAIGQHERGFRSGDSGLVGWQRDGHKQLGAITAPATPAAEQWAGWGTALKPACEPICMARKPLIGTVAENVLEWGTGGINIDGCRIEAPDGVPLFSKENRRAGTGFDVGSNRTGEVSTLGRFPANVVHDGSDDVLAGFPNAGGQIANASYKEGRKTGLVYGDLSRRGEPSANRRYAETGSTNFAMLPGARRGDSGSAARFFYCAKASKADREAGCAEAGLPFLLDANGNPTDRRNPHPTVKPTDLMRWLVRMVTPPGGLVFDPFTGSGSTGRAAILESCQFVGAELTPKYIPIARARIDAAVNSR